MNKIINTTNTTTKSIIPKIKMQNLVKQILKRNNIQSDQIYNAMSIVDRSDFINQDPYDDTPQYINYGATISAPHMHAFALDYLKDYLKEGNKVLDVGYGSGYLCAAFSKMMNDKGKVVGIEHIPQLCKLGKENLLKSYSSLLDNKTIELIEGDGRLGYEKEGPYHCIHVGAAAPVIPQALIDQLANNGRMMIPVGAQNENQYIYLVDKDSNGNIKKTNILGVRYVPLTSKENQIKGEL